MDVTKQEPRLKGSFKQIRVIYREMFFVLHQIFDRFDSIRFMRQQYGSAVLTELSQYVYVYRRDVYAAMINLMRAVENSLETKKPLPQFLPSARILHLRLVNKVRMVLIGDERPDDDSSDEDEYTALENKKHTLTASRRHRMLLKKYMGWSATSSAFEEVIEYLEELVNLTKLLVGHNEFRYGFLSKPIHETWTEAAFSKEWSRSDETYQTSNNGQHSVDVVPSLITTPNVVLERDEDQQNGINELPRLEHRNTLELSKMFKHKNAKPNFSSRISLTVPPDSPNLSTAERPIESNHHHFHLPHLHFNLFSSKDSQKTKLDTTLKQSHSGKNLQVTSPEPIKQEPVNMKSQCNQEDDDNEDQIDDLPATMKRVLSRRYSISSTYSHSSKKRK